MDSTRNKIGSYLFFVVGLMFFLFGLYILKDNLVFLYNANYTTGVVVDYKIVDRCAVACPPKGNARFSYYPQIKFSVGEKEINFWGIGSYFVENYTIGETVKVAYNKKDPNEARISDNFKDYMGGLMVSLSGIVCIIIFLMIRKLPLAVKK